MDEDEISSNIAPGSRFVLHPVTTEYAERQLSQLKTNKAVGLDKISARLLRDSAKIVAPALQHIVNLSFENGQYPSIWKCAKVTALFKQGDRNDKDNYRPISILPTVSKVNERAVHSQFYDFLDTNKLLPVNQFGFRRRRSTEFALAQFTDEVLENMDNGLVTGAVYIDLKKAFDTVNHTIMIKKLKTMVISSTNMAWFHSYLSSRCQKTVIGQAMSATRKATVGVPQGSILGPLLFSIYINYLPACLQNATVTLFADDTALYCSSQSAHELQTLLNEDLDRLAQWLYQHKLTLNISKSKFMLIGGSKKLKSLSKVTLNIKNKELDKVSSYKYLGVVINETLTWDNHVEYIRSKINKKLGLLKRIKSYLPLSARITFFNSFILPLFDYGDLVWSDRGNSTLMSELQVLQNNAARIILDLPPRASSTNALERLSWKTLLRRRAEHQLIFMYKSFNNLFHILFNVK